MESFLVSSYQCQLGVVRFFFSSRRRHTSCYRDWSSDVCSSDLLGAAVVARDMDRAGRAVDRDPHQRVGVGGVRIDPGSLDIGLEDHRLGQHAASRMDAKAPVEADGRRFSLYGFDALIAHPLSLLCPTRAKMVATG